MLAGAKRPVVEPMMHCNHDVYSDEVSESEVVEEVILLRSCPGGGFSSSRTWLKSWR